MLSERDLGWTVGFLEGEGSFSLSGGTPAKHPRVQATQVQLWPLEKLQALFGGWISPKKPQGFGWQPVNSWALTQGPQAVGLMMTLYPLMSPRRQEQIRHCLSIWKATPPNFGEKHRGATVSDIVAREAVRRVLQGESMTSVARSLGLTHSAVSYWVRGFKRPYLREQVSGERLTWGKTYRPGMVTDAVALEAIKRVKSGEMIKTVAEDIGVTGGALGFWVRGRNRSHLLAKLKGES